jgi:hypothetical protein
VTQVRHKQATRVAMVVNVELLHIYEDKFDNFSNICKKIEFHRVATRIKADLPHLIKM